MTPAAKLVNDVIRTSVSPVLRAIGFKVKGRTLHRAATDHVWIVNVQSSIRNEAARASFTLNLGVYYPEVASLVGRQSEAPLPKTSECAVEARIGQLMSEHLDTWWDVSKRGDVSLVGAEVKDALTRFGLPWLTRMSDLRQARDFAGAHHYYQEAAAMSLLLGERDDARRWIRSILDRPETPAPDYARRMVAWAKRVGLD